MKLVIVESPFRASRASSEAENRAYLDECLRDSLLRDEAPFASHKLYVEALRDSVPAERQLGIEAGFEWWAQADFLAFYIDLGWSEGMQSALRKAKVHGKPYSIRSIRENISFSHLIS